MFNIPKEALNVVVVGSGAVGKTCMLLRFTKDGFPGEYIPTVFDNYSKQIHYEGKDYLLVLWDSSGQEDYDRLRPLSYTQSDVVLMCYSIIGPKSFDDIETRWLPEIKHHLPNVPIILVGTRIDLRNDAETVRRLNERGFEPISSEQGRAMAALIGAREFHECSAFTNEGLQEVFEKAIRIVNIPSDELGTVATRNTDGLLTKKVRSFWQSFATFFKQPDQKYSGSNLDTGQLTNRKLHQL